MKQILFLGGTRFFGKKTVHALIAKGYQITLATRGKIKDSFGEQVDRIIVDRSDENHPGWNKIVEKHWDVVFDNICYNKEDAKVTTTKLECVADHLIFISTLSVYEGEIPNKEVGFVESDFDAKHYVLPNLDEITYGEGKRQAEWYYRNHAKFALSIIRIPIVLDEDDYTNRLKFYVDQIKQKNPIYFDYPYAKMSFIKGTEVARLLTWIASENIIGTFNSSSRGVISMSDLIAIIEEVTGSQGEIALNFSEEVYSPFNIPYDWYMSTEKLRSVGFDGIELLAWLKPLIKYYNIHSSN